MVNPVLTLQNISITPARAEEFEAWLDFSDALGFMKENATDDEFVAYAGTTHAFMHAILVPAASVNPADVADLMSWNCNTSSSWGITTAFSDPRKVWISPPLDHTGSKTLDGGEQLLFSRTFEGRLGDDKGYFEVLQRFTHIFELHFQQERNAYCRIDKHGDIEDVIRICKVSKKPGGYGGSIITFKRAVLDEYLALTDAAIVRTFDFTRFRLSTFGGWSNRGDITNVTDGDISYRSHIEPGHAS